VAEGAEHQGEQADRGDVGQGSGMAVMVKVLPFHDELPIPPLVKEKKEESSHSRVFETDSSKS